MFWVSAVFFGGLFFAHFRLWTALCSCSPQHGELFFCFMQEKSNLINCWNFIDRIWKRKLACLFLSYDFLSIHFCELKRTHITHTTSSTSLPTPTQTLKTTTQFEVKKSVDSETEMETTTYFLFATNEPFDQYSFDISDSDFLNEFDPSKPE